MRYGVENLTVRTDDRRYAGRGRTPDWNAFLQRAQAGLRQMLWGSPASEPGVLGRIDKEIGAMRLVYDLPGADDLDRKRVVQGQGVSVRVDLGGRRIIHNKNTKNEQYNQ